MAQPVEHAKKIDALADRFEKEWKAGRKVRIEQVLTQADVSVRSELLQALVEVEIELRRQKGEQPSVAEYRARFPQEAGVVQTAFDSPSKRGKAAASQDTSVSKESVRTGTFSGKAPAAPPQAKVPAMIGRFHVEALLGSGGFGRVYRARDPELDRLVAIKVPLPNKLESDDDIERFLREARSAATLQHPNICPVHEVNRAEGVPYIVMSYVDGKSLADQFTERKTPLPVKQAVLIVRKVATALAAAHAKGIIHRDLKPANIMIDRERKDVIVMDFGLARRVAAQEEANITQSGMIMGTPAYMSPEQARGDAKKVGPASDIYSLGVVLYELVSGKRPFVGSMAEVLSDVLHTIPDLPSAHRKDLDRRIDAICVKALAKDPGQRYTSMKEFADALGECLKEASPASIMKMKPSPSATLKKEEGESTGFVAALRALSDEHREEAKEAIAEAVKRSRTPRWQILVGMGLLGLILLGTVIILFTRSGDVYVQVVLNTKLDERLLKDGTIQFVLDNNPLAVEDLNRPIELKTGEHTLVAYRGKDEVQRYVFVVGQSADGKEASIKITNKTTLMPDALELSKDDGWISLFNGKDLTGWTVGDNDGVMEPAKSPWKVQDGEIVFSVVSQTKERFRVTSEREFTDIRMRFEFQVDDKINAGVCVRSPQEPVRGRASGYVLLGEHTPKMKMGYFQWSTAAVQQVVPSREPQLRSAGTWNEMEIDVQGNRQRVWINGEQILDFDRAALSKHPKAMSGMGRTEGAVGFVASAGTLRLRKIEIRPYKVADDWNALFNGNDLTGWHVESGDPKQWAVEEGAIVARSPNLDKRNYLLGNKDYTDFTLRLEFMIDPGSGAGVVLRALEGEKIWDKQLIDHPILKLTAFAGTTHFMRDDQQQTRPSENLKLPPGVWHKVEITVRGDNCTAVIAGKNIVDIRPDPNYKGDLVPGLKRSKGKIGLQAHTGTIRYRHIEIKELSGPASDGFVSLFNNKDLTGWKTLPQDQCRWEVKDGLLTGTGPVGHLYSERADFADFHLRAEARINDGGNSGMYFRAQPNPGFHKGYEAQINSTHKDPIKTGSLFPAFDPALTIDQKKKIVVKEMLVKPGEWFTQEVIARGNHIVIKVNDKTTVDFIDTKNTFSKGPFALQQHHDGSIVEFRRIEVKELPASQEVGFVSLFNGKDLAGWAGITKEWRVEGGAIVGEVPPKGLPKNLFLSPNLPFPLKDFELRLEAKMIKGNSGIQVRSKRVEDIGFTTMVGPQVEMAHGTMYPWSSLVTEPAAEPSLIAPVEKVNSLLKPTDFNEMYIRCVGKHITITLNGTVTVDADFPTMPAEGLIGLQIHKARPGMRVEFRNIRLKEIKGPAPVMDADRRAVEWLVKNNAHVSGPVDGKAIYVDHMDKLPKASFPIHYIEASKCPVLNDQALAELAPGLTKLETIFGNDTKFTGTGFAPLLKYGELTQLDLNNGSINDAGLEVLCQFPKLWDLSINGNPVTNAGLVHIGKMQGLVQLGLAGTKIRDEGLAHLGKCPKLLRVHFQNTAITDEGLRHLAPLKLTSISLSGNKEKITDKALFYLKTQTNLEDISLHDTHVTDAGLAYLTDLKKMERLPLNKTKVTGKGLGQLEVLPRLVMLHLSDTAVDDAAVPQISRLKGLLDLDLTNTKVTPAGLQRLQDALPKCKIVPPPPKAKDAGADRAAAEHFLKLGGQVQIRVGAEVREPRTAKDLPAENFAITVVVADQAQATDADVKMLADCTSLTNVRIRGAKITDAGLAHLRGLTSLTDFLLVDAGITDAGMKALHSLPLRAMGLNGCKITGATLGPWPELFHLEMNATAVSDAGLRKIGQYRKLQDLRLGSTSLDDAGLSQLHQLAELRNLYIAGTKVTPGGVAKLQKALPKCQITTK